MDIYVWLCGCRERELDYTTKCSCYPCQTPDQCRRRIRSNQEEVFIKLLLVGKTKGLPAIIHCRDTGDGAVAARALELITQLGCTDMRFHRHCFNGDLLQLQQWKTLPNIVFGVTWKSVRESPDFIPRINLDQLVLETDSPYLSLYSCCPTNHPWNLPAVALEVASLRNVPLSVLNWTTNENTEILRHAEGISVLWSGALGVVQMTTSSCKYSVNTFAVVIPGRCFYCDQQMTLVMYISFPYSG